MLYHYIDLNPISEETKKPLFKFMYKRCKNARDNTELHRYFKSLQQDNREIIDFVDEKKLGFVDWTTVALAFYNNEKIQEIKWLNRERAEAEKNLEPIAEHDSLCANSNTVSRVESSLAMKDSSLILLNGHSSWVYSFIQLADGRLVSGSEDESIKLWDVYDGRCLLTLTKHSSAVRTLIQLADGRLASGSSDKSIKLWDVDEGRCLLTLNGHSHYVFTLIQLADGRLASGSSDKSIKLWDVYEGHCLLTLIGHSNEVRTLTQLADGRLASGSFDNSIKLWDVNKGRCLLQGYLMKNHPERDWRTPNWSKPNHPKSRFS